MSRIAYVNGRFLPQRDAMISIEDRGYQFADGVYEVCEVYRGAFVEKAGHLDRLRRSLRELRIDAPMSEEALAVVLREIVARNRLVDGHVYIQVTRGVAPRDHVFPQNTRPSLVVTARAVDPRKGEILAGKGVSVITLPDLRWRRVDIKSISLLPNVLARQAAKENGAFEAWLVDDEGMVTEGAASNAWIVNEEGTVVTRYVDHAVLRGITRTALIDIIRTLGLRIDERRFNLDEAFSAREAFLTAATALVMPVVAIDQRRIGEGRPGPVAQKLRAMFHEMATITT